MTDLKTLTGGSAAQIVGGWLAGRSASSRRVYAVALQRAARLLGLEPGPLFVRLVRQRARRHVVTRDRISVQTIVDALKRRARQAGVDPVRPHDLRRTVAGELLDAGTDISTVARLLGHASVTTTQRYDRRPEHAVAAAAAKIRFPYRRRGRAVAVKDSGAP